VRGIRFILAALLAIAGAAALQADLKKALAEPDLEKRSKLALDNAFAAYQAARDAYQKGEMEPVQAAIDEIEQSVDLAFQSLNDTGKNPRRSPKWFKSAELATRDLSRRIERADTTTEAGRLGLALNTMLGEIQQAPRGDDVVAHDCVDGDAGPGRARRRVHDGVATLGERLQRGEVCFDQRDRGRASEIFGKPGFAPVDAGDGEAAGRQVADEMRADEAAGAGDEDMHRPGPRLRSADGAQQALDAQAMRRQQIVVAAVVVDEAVLQREGVEAAFGGDIPGDLLGLRREPALRHILLDDDHLLALDRLYFHLLLLA